MLTRGEQLILLKENNKRVQEQKAVALEAGDTTERFVEEVTSSSLSKAEKMSLLCGEWLDQN